VHSWAIDWESKSSKGRGDWKCTPDGESITWYTREDFLAGKLLADYPVTGEITAESAHLAARTQFSLAQVYTAGELITLYDVYKDVRLLAFPEMLTPKAREEYGDKDEKDDSAQAIWHYHRNHPEVSLLRWHPKTPGEVALEDALTQQRREMNARLNIMRRMKYDDPQCAHALDILAGSGISDNLRLWSGYLVGPRGGVKWRSTFVMSLYVAVVLEDGTLRRDPATGSPIGERWLWKLLKLHPYHRKAGVARSNLMHHCYRSMLPKFEDGKAAKRSFRLAIAEMRHVLQDAGISGPAVHADIWHPAPGCLSGDASLHASA
jgi:hypothetical protein